MSRYIMAIDANKCINCKACVLACQQRNGTPYGHSRNWVRETDVYKRQGFPFRVPGCSLLRASGRPKRRLPKNFFTIFYKKPIRALHSYAIFPSTGILH